MKEVKCQCPYCEEDITLEVLNDKLQRVECPSCYVLLDVRNEQVTKSNYVPREDTSLESLRDMVDSRMLSKIKHKNLPKKRRDN